MNCINHPSRHADFSLNGKPLCTECHVAARPGRPTQESHAAIGHIHMRVTMARKNAYVQAAKPKGLTEWIFQQLDKASGYETTEQD